jgi:glycolate oxidase FAD binding subunit
MDEALAAFADRIRTAVANQRALCLRGGGSKDFYGGEPASGDRGDVLDTRAHAGIVDYEPSELVVTVRCGTPLAELEAALAAKGQMLAFEPPHFGDAGHPATVGGMLATGLSGPRRQAVGALRDFVLGMKIMDGQGEALSFGGRVMKNVAGYDVSRLVAGSLGTLGLILEASLKTLPVPVAERTLRLELPGDKAVEALNRWAGQPLPISASAWTGGELHLRLSGAQAAVRAAAERLGGEALEPQAAAAFWRDVREHRHPWFGARPVLWRIALPTATPFAALSGLGEPFIEWGGGQRWIATQADAQLVREVAAGAGGHATLFRGRDKDRAQGVFQPLAPALMALHRRLKATFDPHGVFNPGRMYPDF